MTSNFFINSGMDASLAFVGVCCMAALGGWCAGSAIYFFLASDRWLWKHLDSGRRALFCCIGMLVAFFSVIFLPITLPCAHSAWHWHKSKALRREKIYFSLRSLSKLQDKLTKDSMKSHGISQEAAK